MSRSQRVRSAYRSLLIADIQGYSAPERHDTIRSRWRATLRQEISRTLRSVGIDARRHDSQTTGDGLLVSIDPAIGKPTILGPVVDDLATALAAHNRLANASEQLRIRMVVHAADMLIDVDGPFGDQVNFAFRMLCAERFRTLRRIAKGPVLACVSDLVYRQVVAQRHEGMDPSEFEALLFDSKGVHDVGWIRAPGEPGLVARSGILTRDRRAGIVPPFTSTNGEPGN